MFLYGGQILFYFFNQPVWHLAYFHSSGIICYTKLLPGRIFPDVKK